MKQTKILISGAGIAGTTIAYWLARHGFEPTVVERGEQLRSSGNPVDVEGPAIEVAEQMGIIPQLRGAATGSSGITFVNGAGRRVGRINLQAIRRATASRSIQLGCADLASVLYRAVRDDGDIRFGDAIASLAEDQHGVDVELRRRRPRARRPRRRRGRAAPQRPTSRAASAVTWSCTTLRVGWPLSRRLATAKWPSSYSGVSR